MFSTTIERDMKSLAKHAEKIRNSDPATIGTMSIGDVVRQGDLYLVRIESIPDSVKPTDNRKLAPGSTQGSRHVVDGNCRIFEATDKKQVSALIRKASGSEVPAGLIGPVIEAVEPITILHPEHGHRTLPADGVCAVVYQRAFAEELRAVRD